MSSDWQGAESVVLVYLGLWLKEVSRVAVLGLPEPDSDDFLGKPHMGVLWKNRTEAFFL